MLCWNICFTLYLLSAFNSIYIIFEGQLYAKLKPQTSSWYFQLCDLIANIICNVLLSLLWASYAAMSETHVHKKKMIPPPICSKNLCSYKFFFLQLKDICEMVKWYTNLMAAVLRFLCSQTEVSWDRDSHPFIRWVHMEC